MRTGQDSKEQPMLSMEELKEILTRYLPAEECARVLATVQRLPGGRSAEGGKETDAVTGMYSRAGFLRALSAQDERGGAPGEALVILCADVEKLLNIDQVYGHSERDAAIQTFALVLEDNLDEEELCCHLGGGEFAVALWGAGDGKQRAESFVKALERGLDTYNRVSGKEYSLHAVHSVWPVDVSGAVGMQDALEGVLAKKKKLEKSGGQRAGETEEFDPEEHRLVQTVLDQNRFRYAFQPIIDAKTGEICAYEALMRTESEFSLSPLVILKYAKLDNRFYDIEKATFFNVLERLAGEQLGDRKVFINSIPGYQLGREDYRELLRRYGERFRDIVVEITEQTELKEENINEFMKKSAEDGFGIAIDDYGTGYSNMASLLRFLPNCVKIDRILISDIQDNPNKQRFVNDIITFCHENGIRALAEGVETAEELRAVIRMGVDLIQGFYTAKPDFELLEEISQERRNEIVSCNISQHDHTQRKIYIVNGERELSLMRLAMEQYTGLVVSQPELVLVGNTDYAAGMTIKIKDGCSCRVTMRNICLESVEDAPCIDIGKNAQLTLAIEGRNMLDKMGIRVPDGSSCRIEGDGDLYIHARNVHGYGIGNDWLSGFGAVTWASSGMLRISTDGNQCVCVGGGIYRQGEGIRILSGRVELGVTGVEAMGVGCVEGDVPIEITNCSLLVDFRVAKGSAIGSWKGAQKISILNVRLEINGSGSNLCGIGSIDPTPGDTGIKHAEILIRLTGQKVWLIGNAGGGPALRIENSTMKLTGEGNNLLGIGSYDMSANLEIRHVTLEVDLRAAFPTAIGAREDACVCEGSEKRIWINEDH